MYVKQEISESKGTNKPNKLGSKSTHGTMYQVLGPTPFLHISIDICSCSLFGFFLPNLQKICKFRYNHTSDFKLLFGSSRIICPINRSRLLATAGSPALPWAVRAVVNGDV